jgi:hypothetical protein
MAALSHFELGKTIDQLASLHRKGLYHLGHEHLDIGIHALLLVEDELDRSTHRAFGGEAGYARDDRKAHREMQPSKSVRRDRL